MTLPAGSRLGPYEVVAALGAGGMGEVYRARDTRLDRSVAALDHPHICGIHDVGETDGTQFLVMPLVEGRRWRRGSKGAVGRHPPPSQKLRSA